MVHWRTSGQVLQEEGKATITAGSDLLHQGRISWSYEGQAAGATSTIRFDGGGVPRLHHEQGASQNSG